MMMITKCVLLKEYYKFISIDPPYALITFHHRKIHG